ncbi:M20/M25/M40 family metallo-hydrolase [Gemmatimonas sp.]
MRRLHALSADSMEGRLAGSAGGARARAWLVRELNAIGVKPLGARFEMPFTLRQRTPSPDSIGTNIVARIPGKNRGGPVIVLSAHYDHVGVRNGQIYNGADDDASGCVVLLAIAEQLLQTPPQHDVILAFFDAEEGGLQGARAFVANPPLPLGQIGVNVNLDMVARQDGGALWVAGTSHSPFLKAYAEQAASSASVRIRFGHDTKDLKPGDDWTNSSDHGAFHAKAVPFLYLGVEDHPDYHKPGDDADKIDPVFFRGTMEYAAALVRALDGALGTFPARAP